MAITINIYDETYNTTKSISVDFIMEVIAYADPVPSTASLTSAFKFTTGAKDFNGGTYAPRIVTGLDATTGSLALNGEVQSSSNTAADYSSIGTMIEDYVYDYVNGHTANQFLSGCVAKSAMKFST